ncbi:hypothetical protein DYB37_003972 [Aphanomyces astaci]|nr:hypothetical protein DYB35_009413 [Aphanomyces astaci]RHZ13512.1 hypothetical protein DYB37_003972 [Aphanomyces astaci]
MPPPHDRRRDNDQLPPMVPMAMHPLHITPSIPAEPPVAPAQADSDPSSDGESGEKDDDNEPLKKLLGSKKRNRMKDEIDALRKEVGSMTRHLEWLRVSQMHQSPAPLWADIAKQQAHELSRVMAENQHLRHTLEQHLDIAQEYIDTIIPKSVPPGDTVAAPALPIIMCL